MKNRIKYSLIFIISSIAYLFIIGFIDFEIISPFILPEDKCYYHTHKTPLWVEILYMGEGSNGHPFVTLTHLVILLIISLGLGYITVKKCQVKN